MRRKQPDNEKVVNARPRRYIDGQDAVDELQKGEKEYPLVSHQHSFSFP
jgi:hypothetical protein